MSNRMSRYGHLTMIVTVALLLAGCGSGDDRGSQQPATTSNPQVDRSLPDADAGAVPRPRWIDNQKNWPDTIRWAIDSTYEVKLDDLTLRLRQFVSQDISEVRFQKERPLIFEVVTSMGPVPEWNFAKGFNVDSVALIDPVGHVPLRTVFMLSFDRGYDDGIVRTQFLTNMAAHLRQSPDLQEGQILEATIFMSWDGRLLIADMPPVSLGFVRDPDTGSDVDEGQTVLAFRAGMQGAS